MIFFSLALAMVITVFELTDWDIRLQDMFYSFDTQQWLIHDDQLSLRQFFYIGPKIAIIALGVVSGLGIVWSIKNRSVGNKLLLPCILLMASLIIVPLVISSIKSISNVYTPRQIQRYGGTAPYVKAFEAYPKDFHQKKKPKGYPAGHASGGLALMMLYFCFSKKNLKWLGLCAGLGIGWVMGLYQMLCGQHYVSHTIVSTILSWMLICMIHWLCITLYNKQCSRETTMRAC
jgi:membrane-associated PAP2 superfamily phosphatase